MICFMGLSSRRRSEGSLGSRNTASPRISFGSSMPRNQSPRTFFFKSSNDRLGFTFGNASHK